MLPDNVSETTQRAREPTAEEEDGGDRLTT
jgi:hypothetical protein